MTEFYEVTPTDRGPPPEKTDVRFLYDDKYLYVGIRAFTTGTGAPRAPFVRRQG